MRKAFLTILCVLGTLAAGAQTTKGEILEVSRRANDYFMAKWSDPTKPTVFKVERPSNLWTRAVYYEGLIALYGHDQQQHYMDYLDTWGNFHNWKPYKQDMKSVDADYQCCAQAYCQRYFMVGGKEKYECMQQAFDNQIATGNNRHWTWIDAIQMAMPGYAMMTRITGDKKYLDYALDSYIWTRDTCGYNAETNPRGCFNEPEGLWWRDANFVAPYKEPDGKNCYWSRGNGWVVTALCRTMEAVEGKWKVENGKWKKENARLKYKNKKYDQLKKDYLLMMKALVPLQREDGFWNPSLASQNFAGPELSGTAQFMYGMAWGVNNRILDKKTYLPVIEKAWKAMASTVHKDGFIGYVQGSGDRPASSQPVGYNREPDFDDYGLGCFLLAASEYLILIDK